MAEISKNNEYDNNILNLLSDINIQLESTKYNNLLPTDEFLFEEKTQLEYLQKNLQENNLRRLTCFIADFNSYASFKQQKRSQFIVSDKEFDKILNSKQIYINQHQLVTFSGLSLKQQSKARLQSKNSPDYLPHYKINSKTILYKLIDIEQWLEEKGIGTSDYIIL